VDVSELDQSAINEGNMLLVALNTNVDGEKDMSSSSWLKSQNRDSQAVQKQSSPVATPKKISFELQKKDATLDALEETPINVKMTFE
jgi:hypothetical protein